MLIIPIIHGDDTSHCNLYEDVKYYPNILKNDLVVQEFLKHFPEAKTTTQIGIAESLPPQAVLPYVYEYENGTSVKLSIRAIDCIDGTTPLIYGLSIKNDTSNFYNSIAIGEEKIITVIRNYSSFSYAEYEDWINIRGEIVYVFTSSVQSLLERSYLIEKIYSDSESSLRSFQ